MSFIFGGNTGQSYEQIQARRRMAESMMANRGTPRTVGEGLNDFSSKIAGALIAKRADKDDAANEAKASEMFNGIFGPMPTPATPANYAPAPSSGGEGPMEEQIRAGLKQRGMPDHVIDGFIMNFRDESGLRTDINEIAPLVPGSRGGFGLAQWTGPRRKQLEAFAEAQGAPVSDLNVQLDFLMQELSGSERNAANAIFNTQNSGDAATAIVNEFLRPAEVNRARRVAQYGGQGASAPQNGNQNMVRIMQAMSNPYIQRDPGRMAILNALMQQRIQASDPRNQLQLQLLQAQVDAANNPQPETTSAMREYNFAVDQGFEGTFQDYQIAQRRAGASTTNVNSINEGTIPQGYQAVRDEDGRILRLEPIPGGPEDTAAEEAKAEEIKQTSTNLVLDEIQIARDLIEGQSAASPATGITGGLMSRIDSTRAGALKNRLTTIKANIGFDKLQSMRDASPTGGALGQVSEFENRLLQAVFGSLEQSQRGEDILYNLQRLEDIYNRVVHTGISDDEARQLYREITMANAGIDSVNPSAGSSQTTTEPSGSSEYPTTEADFLADPGVQAAATAAGVTPADMWRVLQQRGGQ